MRVRASGRHRNALASTGAGCVEGPGHGERRSPRAGRGWRWSIVRAKGDDVRQRRSPAGSAMTHAQTNSRGASRPRAGLLVASEYRPDEHSLRRARRRAHSPRSRCAGRQRLVLTTPKPHHSLRTSSTVEFPPAPRRGRKREARDRKSAGRSLIDGASRGPRLSPSARKPDAAAMRGEAAAIAASAGARSCSVQCEMVGVMICTGVRSRAAG